MLNDIINIGDKIDNFELIEIIEDDFCLIFSIGHPIYGKAKIRTWVTIDLIEEKEIVLGYLRTELNYQYNEAIKRKQRISHGIPIS